jgi:hypothetical protein
MTTEPETELARLEARVAELERAAKPQEPFKLDYVAPSPYRHLDRLAMPASAMREMVAAVPNDLVRAIATERYATAPVSPIAKPDAMPNAAAPMAVNKTGWRESAPLAPPPGQEIIAALCDAALGPAVPKKKKKEE